MSKLPWLGRIAALASLGDATRRKLFSFVASAAAPVSRNDAAESLDLPRSTASFHLDRMVVDGLLAVEFKKLGGREGPGSGRPAKLYKPAVREVGASVPERNYDLAAELLVSAVEESSSGGIPVHEALVRSARARGQAAAGGAEGPEAFAELLAAQGYVPEDDGAGGLVLLNCPFHRIAAGHTGVVCAMNGAFLGGAAEGCGIPPERVEALAVEELRKSGAAGPAQCCARILPL
jgi:predicted ArsR family transcriptional regulator